MAKEQARQHITRESMDFKQEVSVSNSAASAICGILTSSCAAVSWSLRAFMLAGALALLPSYEACAEADALFIGGISVDDGAEGSISEVNVCGGEIVMQTPTSTPTPSETFDDQMSTATSTPTVTPDLGNDGCGSEATPTPMFSPTSAPQPSVSPQPTVTTRSARAFLGDFGNDEELTQLDAIDEILRKRRGSRSSVLVDVVSSGSGKSLATLELPKGVGRVAPVLAQTEQFNSLVAGWFDRSNQKSLFARYDPASGQPIEAIAVPAKVKKIRQTRAISGCRNTQSSMIAVTSSRTRNASFIFDSNSQAKKKVRAGGRSEMWCSASPGGQTSVLFAGTVDKRRQITKISAWDTATGWRLYSRVVPKFRTRGALFATLPARGEEQHEAPRPVVFGRVKDGYTLLTYHPPSYSWVRSRFVGLPKKSRITGISIGFLSDRESAWIAIEYRNGSYLLSKLDKSTLYP